jgi:gluconolactonase
MCLEPPARLQLQSQTRISPAVMLLPAAVVLLGILTGLSSAQDFPGAGEVKKLHDGFIFTEGPAYDGKHLYFTDIPNNRIMRTDLDGKLEVFLEPSGKCNGLMFDRKNRLIACRMGVTDHPTVDGELIAIDIASKEIKSLAIRYDGKRFNACNDLVIDKTGGIYFTDPRYGAPDPWPQGKEAIYYRSNKGVVTRLEENIYAPNGIILSPDESTLIVVPSLQKQVYAYAIKSPGILDNKRVLFELVQPQDKENSGGDGLSVDVDGNFYITSDLGIQVISSDGKLLGIIAFPEQPANCAFGGPEMKTLFATSRTGIYGVEMPVAGHRFSGIVD